MCRRKTCTLNLSKRYHSTSRWESRAARETSRVSPLSAPSGRREGTLQPGRSGRLFALYATLNPLDPFSSRLPVRPRSLLPSCESNAGGGWTGSVRRATSTEAAGSKGLLFKFQRMLKQRRNLSSGAFRLQWSMDDNYNGRWIIDILFAFYVQDPRSHIVKLAAHPFEASLAMIGFVGPGPTTSSVRGRKRPPFSRTGGMGFAGWLAPAARSASAETGP